MKKVFVNLIYVLLATFLCLNVVHAAGKLRGKGLHHYNIKITSLSGKSVRISGSMMQWVSGKSAPDFYDFTALKIYTPYEANIEASDVVVNVASVVGGSELIKVEITSDDDSGSLRGMGNMVSAYQTSGIGNSFVMAY